MLPFGVIITEKFGAPEPERDGNGTIVSDPHLRSTLARLPHLFFVPCLRPPSRASGAAVVSRTADREPRSTLLNAFLTGSASQTEFDVTPTKQTTGKFLTGARTHIKDSAAPHIFARKTDALTDRDRARNVRSLHPGRFYGISASW